MRACRGAKVIAPVRSKNSADKLGNTLGGDSPSLLQVVISDVSDEAACSSLADAIVTEHGSLDHVVSCIGGMPPAKGVSRPSLQDDMTIFLHSACIWPLSMRKHDIELRQGTHRLLQLMCQAKRSHVRYMHARA
jgi:NAD(P)-dependent dehydrogenase (short-subunit alcohol dehydrogenase family)